MSTDYKHAESPTSLAERWLKRLRESQFAHYEAAERLSRANTRLGIPVVIFSAMVGTSIFASLGSSNELPTALRIAAGLISISAAVLASLQTFLKFSERAEKHRAIAARYGAIRRQIEQILAFEEINSDVLKNIRSQIDTLGEEAPEIPKHIFDRMDAYLKGHDSKGVLDVRD